MILIRRNKPAFHIKYGTEYTNFFLYYMFNTIGLLLDNCMPTTIYNDEYLVLLIHCFNDIKYLFQENLNLLIDGQYDDLELNNSISLETSLLQKTFINKKIIIIIIIIIKIIKIIKIIMKTMIYFFKKKIL